jgi:hypothetical protein
VQLYIAASGSEVLETFLEAIFESLFSSSVPFLMASFASQKCISSVLFSLKETGKYQLEPVRTVWGMLQFCHFFFAEESLTRTDRCAGAFS